MPFHAIFSFHSMGAMRLGVPCLLLRQEAGESEAADTLAPDEALIVDAGFSLSDLRARQTINVLAYATP